MMSIESAVLLALIMFLNGALSIFAVWSSHSRLERRLSTLEQAEEQRQKTLADARGRERAHHAYNTLAAAVAQTSSILVIRDRSPQSNYPAKADICHNLEE